MPQSALAGTSEDTAASSPAAAGLAAAFVDQPLPMPAQVIVMGDYLVGDAEDAQLGGHPDIRY